ncbi:hypothetical protein NQZ68_001467 [Dissostichus eleginoides]|nr:hypothetical protein NQZ68_001467 [Dissostichus eleginoides]
MYHISQNTELTSLRRDLIWRLLCRQEPIWTRTDGGSVRRRCQPPSDGLPANLPEGETADGTRQHFRAVTPLAAILPPLFTLPDVFPTAIKTIKLRLGAMFPDTKTDL